METAWFLLIWIAGSSPEVSAALPNPMQVGPMTRAECEKGVQQWAQMDSKLTKFTAECVQTVRLPPNMWVRP